MSDHVLDNPFWHALNGPQRNLAEVGAAGLAARFAPDIAVFGGIVDESPDAWADLATLLDGEHVVCRFEPDPSPPPDGWREFARVPCHQFVAGDIPTAPALELAPLGDDDVDEMLELVALTEPGPFERRTVHTGPYVGLRRDGALIAMAGQRGRLPGWSEISAVCVHPSARREGLGAALTLAVAAAIRAEGDEAFLHVMADNPNAIALYEKLGFQLRTHITVSVVAPERGRE